MRRHGMPKEPQMRLFSRLRGASWRTVAHGGATPVLVPRGPRVVPDEHRPRPATLVHAGPERAPPRTIPPRRPRHRADRGSACRAALRLATRPRARRAPQSRRARRDRLRALGALGNRRPAPCAGNTPRGAHRRRLADHRERSPATNRHRHPRDCVGPSVTAVVLGLLVAGAALVLAYGVVWLRWRVRDRRRRRNRLEARRRARDELERALYAHVRVVR